VHDKLFETALGIAAPWFVAGLRFDEKSKVLTIGVDFAVGSRFRVEGTPGDHPVHDTVTKTYRHLNFFQHECVLDVRTPRVKLPNGSVRLVKPEFAGKLSGFTLLFEALVLMLAPQMPFAAVARTVGISAHRVQAICEGYVAQALHAADFSTVTALAIDETSRARGHDYITLAADAEARRVLAVAEGRDAKTVTTIAAELTEHGCPAGQITSVSIDMSPAFIKGCTEALPNARITFDKFHVVWHANAAVDKMRRIEQRTDPSLKGMRWSLLKPRQAQARGRGRSGRTHRAHDHRANRPGLGLQGAAARDSRAQADPCRSCRSAPVVHLRHAVQSRADEGCRCARSSPSRGNRRVGTDSSDQWLPRSPQWTVPGRKTPRAWLHKIQNDQDGDLPDRWQTQLPRGQSSRPKTHLKFSRA
jgi:hypothetical protein